MEFNIAFLLPPISCLKTFCSRYIPANINGTIDNVTKANFHSKYKAEPMAILNVDRELRIVPIGWPAAYKENIVILKYLSLDDKI